jgi:hypothetical protein
MEMSYDIINHDWFWRNKFHYFLDLDLDKPSSSRQLLPGLFYCPELRLPSLASKFRLASCISLSILYIWSYQYVIKIINNKVRLMINIHYIIA